MTDARATAADFLAGDPRVASFAVADGAERLEIEIVAAADWVAAQRAAAHAGLESRILKQWQMVYDRSYRWDREIRPPDFDAWVSGFTGAAIPIPRMQIWLDDALAKMRSVPHARVIEIGCGVGLVLAALAPGGSAYHGIDLSQEAIASLGAWVATQPALAHVRLAQRAADEQDGLAPDGADLAVLNSVVQYFPDAAYLGRVLAELVPRLVAGGAIFLGDLRAAALLPMRASAIAAGRAASAATVAEVRAEAEAVLGLARELAIDPGHLDALGTRLPRLGAVGYFLKPAAADHELSGYRYDAILHLDAPREPPAPILPACALEALVAHLDGDRPAAVAVLGLPNARLAADAALARALAAAAPETPLSALSIVADPAAIEPDALAAEAAARGYRAELRFALGSSEGRFDVLLRRPGARAAWPSVPTPAATSNDPLGDELAAKLRRELQASLDATLGGRGRARIALTL